jgi:hypothetical protein
MATKLAPSGAPNEPFERQSALLTSSAPAEVDPAEKAWGVELPPGLTVEVTRDPSVKETWKNAFLINMAWEGEGKREAKVTLAAYPKSETGSSSSVVVTDVRRPAHWDKDTRDVEIQANEYQIGLAAGLQRILSTGEKDLFGRNVSLPVTKVIFNPLNETPTALALARLETPEGVERKADLKFNGDIAPIDELIKRGGVFSAEYRLGSGLNSLGGVAIRSRAAAPDSLIAPERPYDHIVDVHPSYTP